jgi:hypothetical protein
MRRVTIIAIGLMLVMAACASGGAGGEATDPPGPAGPGSSGPAGGDGTDPTAAPTADSDDPLSGFRDEDATAVVVIGDERYEFEGLYCVTMFGALSAASVGDVDPKVNIQIPPDGWETSGDEWDPPSVHVASDEPYFRMEANAGLVDELSPIYAGSQVDSFTTDGYRASGTGLFLDSYDFTPDQELVAGRFEVSCPRP